MFECFNRTKQERKNCQIFNFWQTTFGRNYCAQFKLKVNWRCTIKPDILLFARINLFISFRNIFFFHLHGCRQTADLSSNQNKHGTLCATHIIMYAHISRSIESCAQRAIKLASHTHTQHVFFSVTFEPATHRKYRLKFPFPHPQPNMRPQTMFISVLFLIFMF